ncbi:iron-containing alcohol dehydrogenase [Pleomorphovibrio marinus]|uniref:iron-containing alcohol dehydrogenase n=1 Tax=Pleomorphovibrio marinus TaxID=2164132 RepID=UPI000E0B4ADB|nr:iron-containing alcohol dehydrogenase [Pleomorphovibrio marinus]
MNHKQIYSFSFPTTIRFGPGAILELPDYLSSKGVKKPLLVTDPNVAHLEFFSAITGMLQKRGLAFQVFKDMGKNPVKSEVLNGKSNYLNAQCDAIVGIGGGVPLDVARAIALSINHKRDLFDYDDLIGGDKYVTEPIPLFVAVPTTAGTGSEVGRSAIIAEDDTKKKRILFSPSLLAKMVFADPELTMELPPFITAATGMDALTHLMEAFLAKNWHPMCSGIALEGMRLLSGALVKATKNPDLSSRSDMLMASMMGAVAFQKGLGVVHSLAHPLSGLLDTHHGLANAVNLPYGMSFNYEGFEQQFDQMASCLGVDKGNEVVDYIFQLNEELELPSKLRDVGVKEEHLETLSDLAYADFCHPNNPKPVLRDDFLTLYKKAF